MFPDLYFSAARVVTSLATALKVATASVVVAHLVARLAITAVVLATLAASKNRYKQNAALAFPSYLTHMYPSIGAPLVNPVKSATTAV